MLDSDIERAIDTVARETTAGDPGTDFRARVIARIDAGATPRTAWRIWIPAAAAIALVIVVIVASRRIVRPPTVAQPFVAQPFRAAPDTPVVDIRSTLKPRRPARSVQRPTALPITASDLDDMTPPLEIPAIAIGEMTTEPSLDIAPLDTIPPMAIASLGDEGDRR